MTSLTDCISQGEGNKDVPGTYSNESTRLELLDNGTFILVLDTGLLTITGSYSLLNESVTLIERESSSKSYRLRNLEKTAGNDVRIRILTENGIVVSGMFCEFASDGVIKTSYTDENGVCVFKEFRQGLISFSRMGLQSVEIDTMELESNSIEVIMIQNRFKENIDQFVFVFEGDKLVGETLKGEVLSKE